MQIRNFVRVSRRVVRYRFFLPDNVLLTVWKQLSIIATVRQRTEEKSLTVCKKICHFGRYLAIEIVTRNHPKCGMKDAIFHARRV